MTLEEEIKQIKPFPTQRSKALVNIIFTGHWVYFRQSRLIKDFDITIQQYNVLRILNGQNGHPVTIKEIIERMLDKMSNASRLVDKLHQKDLVSRNMNPKNRRSCDVKITEKGCLVLKEMTERMSLLERSFGEMTEEEYLALNTLLDKLRDK